tara:strand:- start:1985 stop:3052 length:1068 start_codon:yes stop_codon:yes gene_type:complete
VKEQSLAKWRNRELARTFFFFSTIVIMTLALASVPRVSAPLLLAYVISLMVKPGVPVLTKLGIPRVLAIATLLLGLIGVSAWPIAKIVPLVSDEARNVQFYVPKVEEYIRKQYVVLKVEIKDRTGYDLNDVYLYEFLDSANKYITSSLLTLPKFLAAMLEWFFLVPLFTFFILKDGTVFRDLMLNICPNSLFERFYSLTHEFGKKIGGYIFAKFIEASIVFVLITAGLWFLDVRFSFLLGLLAGVTNIIPYVGPLFGAVPALIYALADYGAGGTFVAIATLYTVANAVDIAIVFPILVSRIVDLHPLLVVVSVILGSQSMGVVGMVISIPLAAAFKLIILEIYQSIYTKRGGSSF